ncbi:hypothetical protein COLO4_28353 [Corchorus olitorius]|uniref:Uncharacterized protein n=1 Tax=Corchorus olitorius TaxID=93759 RepID=A0A1R3HLM4_9ROSI|nr:hypothetical protein COLO4_28353 [Corchorus olitorius]
MKLRPWSFESMKFGSTRSLFKNALSLLTLLWDSAC